MITQRSVASRLLWRAKSYTTRQKIFIDFLSVETYIMSGVWEIVLEAGRVVEAGGGYAAYTGTLFATPFVTGSCALMMDWGIILF